MLLFPQRESHHNEMGDTYTIYCKYDNKIYHIYLHINANDYKISPITFICSSVKFIGKSI